MEYLFSWESGVFDEMSLVYQRASAKEDTKAQLCALEQKALEELHASFRLIPRLREMKREDAEALHSEQKEVLIADLAAMGLLRFNAEIRPPVIHVEFSPLLPQLMGCTFFSVLNRIEKLEGGINALAPKVDLELRVPLGAKKGLFQWEFLLLQLYPWLSIHETSSNLMAVQPVPPREEQHAAGAPERESPKSGTTASAVTQPVRFPQNSGTESSPR